MVLCSFGASYGMAKSGIGVMAMGILRPDRVMQSESSSKPCRSFLQPVLQLAYINLNFIILSDMMPPILASIISIYGLVVAVMIANSLIERLPLFTGFLQLAAGVAVGLSGMAAGYVC